jgi:LysM repeat protein
MSEPFPKFNQALGNASLTSVPPFELGGVIMRVFPLRAKINALNLFCDRYLNLAPDIVQFRPAAPLVRLMIVNYPRMAPEVRNVGWVAQNEVVFNIPLEMYRVIDGKPVFEDFASIAAYIFVDDAGSQATGREVYGWPKDRAWLGTTVNSWAMDPDREGSLLELATMAFPEVYRSARQKPSTLLEVSFNAPVRWTRFPPSPIDRGVNPFIIFQQAMTRGMTLTADFIDFVTGLSSRGYPERDLVQQQAKLLKFMQGNDPLGGQALYNTVNLKQFRDAEEPQHACYQAIVNSRMRLTRYNTGSLLGDEMFIGTDPSAGFRIRFHRYPALPIIETLGLEVEEERPGQDVPVATLCPVMPFWVSLDMIYEKGQRLCWRTKHSAWQPEPEWIARTPVRGRGEEASAKPHPVQGPGARVAAPATYNVARGASRGSATGPFAFPEVTIRVLPLMADPEKLKRFCDEYLNQNVGVGRPYLDTGRAAGHEGLACHRFEAVGSYVYMLIVSYKKMWSGSNDLGQWAHRSVQFSIPVKWYTRDDHEELFSMGLVSPYRYADSNIGTFTGREVFGLTTYDATIESPPDSWMNDSGPVTDDRGLLSLDTTVLKAVGAGGEMKPRRLLDVEEADALPYNADLEWLGVAERWGGELKRDLREKQSLRDEHPEDFRAMRALALELLVNRKGYNEISLKQFRDSEEPEETACYQAAVRSKWIIDRLWDLQEIEQRIHLKIYRYATQPIVESLGLKVKHEDTSQYGLAQTLQPIRPFWLRADIRSGPVDNLWELSVGGRLSQKHGRDLNSAPDSAGRGGYFADQQHIDVGVGLAESIDNAQIESLLRSVPSDSMEEKERRKELSTQAPIWETRSKKQNMSIWSAEWRERARREAETEGGEGKLLTLEQACRAVENIPPQMAIESILSNEWGSWGNARWRRALRSTQQAIGVVEDKPMRAFGAFIAAMHDPDLHNKPDFCVRRDSVGSSKEQIFPRAESFDDNWYPGKGDGELGDSIMARVRELAEASKGQGGQDLAPRIYTIQAGDTLSQIAQRYGISLSVLAAFNRGLDTTRIIEIGQLIQLPPGAKPTYTVVAGDSLSKIARANKTNVDTLVKLNRFVDESDKVIHPGQVLVLPN